jgi:hypothetical protein
VQKVSFQLDKWLWSYELKTTTLLFFGQLG